MSKAKMTKSDFVRKHPGKTAAEVIALGKKSRLKLSDRYVYVIRSSDKAKARRNGKPGRKTNGNADATLRTAIAELGLARAREVLAEVERAFGA